ncbi:MAG: hypothetical protein QOD61_2621, partial [Solirubrobacteraceae bacterium]|nr:hypothetical protein [Solirubrobacteraceae bacterium]
MGLTAGGPSGGRAGRGREIQGRWSGAGPSVGYLRDEPGAELVADAIAGGVAISAVNLAEVLSRAADRGADPAGLAGDLADRGL